MNATIPARLRAVCARNGFEHINVSAGYVWFTDRTGRDRCFTVAADVVRERDANAPSRTPLLGGLVAETNGRDSVDVFTDLVGGGL